MFRIFTNDVGANRYSCFSAVEAHSANAALACVAFPEGAKVFTVLDTPDALALYGPNGQTGKLPHETVLASGRVKGHVAGPRRQP